MRRFKSLLSSAAILATLSIAPSASAFCGFYVAKADGDLFNDASKVVLARKGDRTVVTMTNNYEGDPTEFAMVIPVSTTITRDQVHIADMAAINAVDAFSAPRLVEYFDDDPCSGPPSYGGGGGFDEIVVTASKRRDTVHGVAVEESFSVGEYDIQVLSAKQSGGLVTWLNENDYKLPSGAERILSSYIRQDMKFFVAKVNLQARDETGEDFLRPISIAYESPKFMLPIRLGTLNARGKQDLIVLALTPEGKVETTNYRTQKIPTDKNIPTYLKKPGQFGEFYKAMFDRTVKRAGGSGVFLEYFWDVESCDPCSAPVPTPQQLLELGVFWADDIDISDWDHLLEDLRDEDDLSYKYSNFSFEPYWGDDVSITRLHVRYDAKSFPEDLKFHVTGEDEDAYFQGRYVMTHPYASELVNEYEELAVLTCDAKEYLSEVNNRQRNEVATLSHLTSWSRDDIRQAMRDNGDMPYSPTFAASVRDKLLKEADDATWWRNIWPYDDDNE